MKECSAESIDPSGPPYAVYCSSSGVGVGWDRRLGCSEVMGVLEVWLGLTCFLWRARQFWNHTCIDGANANIFCRAAFDGNKHKHQCMKSGNLNLAERRLELGWRSRVWTCPGVCWRNHCQQWKFTQFKLCQTLHISVTKAVKYFC